MKCPKCENFIGSPNATPIKLNVTTSGDALTGLVITCPTCSTILTVTIDPFSLADEIESRIKD
jgi:RNase P subunit RPR2